MSEPAPELLVEREGPVLTLRINRPAKRNALNANVLRGLREACDAARRDASLRVVIVTGGEQVFAAGADIGEFAAAPGVANAYRSSEERARTWDALALLPQPTIAAVAGYALGGGCELAMACDLRLAADTAIFGQPEIKLGVIPGIGGTQRLTRAVGKAKAMDLCLTGRMMDAAEAERSGLVARVVPLAELMTEAMKAAETIAAMSLPAVIAAKESVNRAFETTLSEGIRFERRAFHPLFATEDQKEGMAAFIEKRPPRFKNR